jgi:hypothetical protein
MADLAGASVISSPAAVIEQPRTGSAPAGALPSPPAATGVCEFLDWDSKFFGIRIARVAGHRLDAERATEIARAVRGQSPDPLARSGIRMPGSTSAASSSRRVAARLCIANSRRHLRQTSAALVHSRRTAAPSGKPAMLTSPPARAAPAAAPETIRPRG